MSFTLTTQRIGLSEIVVVTLAPITLPPLDVLLAMTTSGNETIHLIVPRIADSSIE